MSAEFTRKGAGAYQISWDGSPIGYVARLDGMPRRSQWFARWQPFPERTTFDILLPTFRDVRECVADCLNSYDNAPRIPLPTIPPDPYHIALILDPDSAAAAVLPACFRAKKGAVHE